MIKSINKLHRFLYHQPTIIKILVYALIMSISIPITIGTFYLTVSLGEVAYMILTGLAFGISAGGIIALLILGGKYKD